MTPGVSIDYGILQCQTNNIIAKIKILLHEVDYKWKVFLSTGLFCSVCSINFHWNSILRNSHARTDYLGSSLAESSSNIVQYATHMKNQNRISFDSFHNVNIGINALRIFISFMYVPKYLPILCVQNRRNVTACLWCRLKLKLLDTLSYSKEKFVGWAAMFQQILQTRDIRYLTWKCIFSIILIY